MESDTRAPLASGRFVLRLSPALHQRLRTEAERMGLSLNEHCVRKLGTGSVEVPLPGVVRRVADHFGSALVAIIAFGSWARGDMNDSSDIDVLVVLDRSIPIARALYEPWDASPILSEGRLVEPHLVHLPGPDDRLSSLWAQVAIEGIVLFERDLSVSRRMIRFRERIALEEVVRRRVADGQYWVGAP